LKLKLRSQRGFLLLLKFLLHLLRRNVLFQLDFVLLHSPLHFDFKLLVQLAKFPEKFCI